MIEKYYSYGVGRQGMRPVVSEELARGVSTLATSRERGMGQSAAYRTPRTPGAQMLDQEFLLRVGRFGR